MDHSAHALHGVAFVAAGGDALAPLAVAAALFLTGLAGGLAHCGPMCGPFVLAQLPGEGGTLQRLAGALLLPYQAGRLVTYTALGAAAAGLGEAVVRLSGFRWLLAVFLAFAALLFLRQTLPRRFAAAGPALPGAAIGARLARVSAPLMRRNDALGRFGLGLALGFLPCGFLYAALAAAAATGSAGGGALAMAGFALGTVPSLWAVGLLGAAAAQRWRGLAGAATTPLYLANAMALAAMAVRAALA